MIYTIWIVWFSHQMFVFLILMNFFIALIGQAYEESMAHSEIDKYHYKAQLNRECYSVYSCCSKLEKYSWFSKLATFDTIILETAKHGHDSSQGQWGGITKQLKKNLKNEI